VVQLSPQTPGNCRVCQKPLPPLALACPNCHAIVHSDKLEAIAEEAKILEKQGDLGAALAAWRSAGPLLPADCEQAAWLQKHISELENELAHKEEPPQSKWKQALGPLGVLGVVLFKFKSLIALIFNAKFLFSLAAFVAVYWQLYGWRFGVGFAASILVHEMGHYVEIRRRGLQADMPVFLPGMGAYVRWRGMGVSASGRAAISLAGPFAGLLGAVVCALMWQRTGHPFWASLAHVGAWLNALNLVPVWILDGGHAFVALSRPMRFGVLVASLVLWLGLHEGIFFLVALGTLWRLFFAKDVPEEEDYRMGAFFIALMLGLAFLSHATQGQARSVF